MPQKLAASKYASAVLLGVAAESERDKYAAHSWQLPGRLVSTKLGIVVCRASAIEPGTSTAVVVSVLLTMNDAAQDAAGRLHTQITLPKVTRTQNYQHVNGKLTNLRNRVDPSIRLGWRSSPGRVVSRRFNPCRTGTTEQVRPRQRKSRLRRRRLSRTNGSYPVLRPVFRSDKVVCATTCCSPDYGQRLRDRVVSLPKP